MVANIIKQDIIASAEHSFKKVIKDHIIQWWHTTGKEVVDIGN